LPNLLPKQFASHEEMMQEAHTLMTSELYG